MNTLSAATEKLDPVSPSAVEIHAPHLAALTPDEPRGESGRNLDLILDIPVSVRVELGRASVRIQDLLDLQSGAVIDLDRRAGAPVDVMVNGKLVAQGEVVVVDGTFGVRITTVVEAAARIRSLEGNAA